MQEPDAVRPDQREFFCQATFLNRLQHAPDSRKFSVSLRLAQAQHPMWHHLRKPQLLHVRASLHSIWPIDANRSFLLRPETSSSFLHKTRNSPTGKQEYPDLYTCLAATLTAVNRPAFHLRRHATGAALTDGSCLRLNRRSLPRSYRAVGISLPSSDAFLAEPSPAIRSRITSL